MTRFIDVRASVPAGKGRRETLDKTTTQPVSSSAEGSRESAPASWQISFGEGMRRLPVYLLLDCSFSMAGASIEAVRRGVELFRDEVVSNPFARETVHVGIITFNSRVELITRDMEGNPGLAPIEHFQVPELKAEGRTKLGLALRELQRSIDTHVRLPRRGGQKGDYKPLVFILTDGEPTDDWQTPRSEILHRIQRKVVNVFTVGCGPDINEDNLRQIAIGSTFLMDSSDASFAALFNWISQSVNTISSAAPPIEPQAEPVVIPKPKSNIFVHIS